MTRQRKEKRKYDRYDTEVKIYFRVNYDLKTKVEFQLIDDEKERLLSRKYPGLSSNVSVEGLRFRSSHKLKKEDVLYIEVYLPKQKNPIYMAGKVRWSKKLSMHPKDKYKFDTGVKLIEVLGQSVPKSIHFDKKHQIIWSIVLDSVFGSFKKFVRENAKKRK